MARARVLITLAWATVALHGRSQALDLLGEVRSSTDSPRLLALSHVQEAVVHVSCADWRAALAALDRVGASFGLLTPHEQTSALINGGLSHLSLLELEPARAELEQALELARAHGAPEQEFKARHNLGCLAFYAGQLPEAITLMRAADEMDVPVDRARAKHDLALVLLEAGLLDEAHAMLVEALGQARSERLRLEEGDIRSDLATCALLRDDPAAARRQLDAAVKIFGSRGVHHRQRSTRLVRAAVDVSVGRGPRSLESLLQPWLHVEHPVTPDERLAVRVNVEALLLRGDVTGAARAADRLAGPARQGLAGDLHDRLLFAKVAAAQGDTARARRVVRTALNRLAARQAPSQSLEVRSALALHGRRLSEFDVDDALRSGSPRRVFDSVERWRAVSHRLPPLSAEVDDALTVELVAALRQTRRLMGTAGDDEAEQLRTRAAALQGRIAQRDWATGDASTPTVISPPTTLAATRAALQDRREQAVILFTHAGTQFLLEVSPTRARLHTVGPAAEVAALADRLRRDLRGQAFAEGNPALAQTLQRAVASSASDLDHRLLSCLALEPDTGVLVVPGRFLASVPWGMLPSFSGRPVTVSTSVTRWSSGALDRPATRPLTTVAVAGPGLRRAQAETHAVHDLWRGAGALATEYPQATSTDLKTALTSAALVHVSAHGSHEEQSPFFSSLQLVDGPVFAHELPRPVGARHVVLSACDVGQSDLRPGDEPLGLTAALLALGVQGVVAAVAPVPDAAAEKAMVTYHQHLAAGEPASRALASTMSEHPSARAFCLYGSDWAVAG